jgi:2-polyprenyl-3-methyl-5-hydroxy-6-metoxy-1,4-benzoquinol methylase
MERQKNTSLLWDTQVWTDIPTEKEDKYRIEFEKKSIQWKRIKKTVLKEFGSFKNLKTIEIGAGRGTYSLLFALNGAEVTILDYSQKAIDSSKLFFERNGIKANFITMDALKIDENFAGKYDLSMSFGTAEHFLGEKRINFIKSHFDVLRKGGITFICVPNKWNPPYSVWKFLSERMGRWKFGEEYPFSVLEFKKIQKKIRKKFKYEGVSLFDTPFNILERIDSFFGFKEQYNLKNIHRHIGTPLDGYFSRTIMAVGKNN